MKRDPALVREYDFSYNDDLVLAGIGGRSEGLVDLVAKILQRDFGFNNVDVRVNRDDRNIMPFLDSEPQYQDERSDIEAFEGKHVVFIQHPKIFDNRGRDEAEGLRAEYEVLKATLLQRLKKTEGMHPGHVEKLLKPLLTHVREIERLLLPDTDDKVAARFVSSRFHPSVVLNQMLGQVDSAAHGNARHVTTLMPKSIFEWSHNSELRWSQGGNYQLPMWKFAIQQLAYCGANSIGIVHPHAPVEGREYAQECGLNYLAVFPHTFTINSNAEIIDPDKFLAFADLTRESYDPLRAHIMKEIDALEQSSLAKRRMFIAQPDEGADTNASGVSRRFGLALVTSGKTRSGEGAIEITDHQSIYHHLEVLKNHSQDGPVIIKIIDDKISSGTTANTQAEIRKEEVYQFNREHGTNYEPRVELIATHFRGHEVPALRHEHLDSISFMNTVVYFPPLEEQLDTLGISDKVEIWEGTAEQLALLTAFDYHAQRIHHERMGQPRERRFRGRTDHNIRLAGYGKDLAEMRRPTDIRF